MRTAFSIFLAGAVGACLGSAALAQNAISAKAGMINVADGDVFIVDAKGGEPRKVEPKVSEFVDLKEGQTLRTTDGRAEVLLTPGSFLRMADNSSFKLFSNRLTDVRLEVLSGSALIEATEMLEGNEITVLAKDATAVLTKGGLYRFDAEPSPRIRVYMGEAVVERNGQKTTLKGGRELLASGGNWTMAKFDAKDTDSLYRWSKRRSGYIAMANVSAARQSTFRGNGFTGGNWYYNPYFGFATYVPWGDTLRSPFGYYYYTPATVMAVYYPPRPAYNGGGGFGGMGSGGFASSMPSRSAGGSTYTPSAGVSAPAPSAGSSVGAGSVGSRGGGGAVSSGAAGGGGARGGRGN